VLLRCCVLNQEINEARTFNFFPNRTDTVEKIAKELKERFHEDLTEKDWRSKLNSMKMKEDEK
jgi:uncharacterized protein YqgQ